MGILKAKGAIREVLLSFDVEEFDFPRERGQEISLDEGVKVSTEGLKKIIGVLDRTGVKATFFVTGNFAKKKPEMIKRLVTSGHEIGAHGVDHFEPKTTDIKEAKKILEKKGTGVKVRGWRQPRMMKIDYDELAKNGYQYDSSVNPAFIPGRYNHLDIPRNPYPIKTKTKDILEIPVSVAMAIRVPLFWLALHLFPLELYYWLAKNSLKKTGYFATYFHPWEFADLTNYAVVPGYIRCNSGDKLEKRLEQLIIRLKADGCSFITYSDYCERLTGVELTKTK